MKHKRAPKGFTLVELLVVISIIGLLSSIVYASVNSSRVRARDVRRVVDVRQIEKAVQLYAADHGGDYPMQDKNVYCLGLSSAGTCWAGRSGDIAKDGVIYGSDALVASLAPYMPSGAPVDPQPT
jgi:prepilin-type N-terminal cleavage/methylation domain-containing protein